MNNKSIVYCAGSQYSPEEKRGMLEIASLLEKSGFDTYLSFRDGIGCLIPRLMKHPEVKQSELSDLINLMNRVVFALETFQVTRRCDSIVLNMNGRVPDEGSVFNAALAFTAGRPVIIYKNDNRSVFHGYDNTMVTGLSGGLPIMKRINHIPRGLKRAMGKCKSSGGPFYYGDKIPPSVQRVIVFGEEVWNTFNKTDMLKNDDKDFYEKLLRFKDRFGKTENMTAQQHHKSIVE